MKRLQELEKNESVTYVCPSVVLHVLVTLANFQILLWYYKMSLIKVVSYVLKVKNMHSRSPLDPLGP